MNLVNLLELTQKNKSDQLLVHTSSRPKFKKRNEWEPLTDTSLSPALSRELCVSVLTQDERHHLQEYGYIYGVVRLLPQLKIQFSITLNEIGLTGLFKIIELEIKDFLTLGIPGLLQEAALRGQPGWILITGHEGQSQSQVGYSILQSVNTQKSYHVVCMEEMVQVELKSEKSSFSQLSITTEELVKCNRHHFMGAQIVYLDAGFSENILYLVSELVMSGKLVIMISQSGTVQASIEQIVENTSIRQEVKKYLVSQLISAICIKNVDSIQDGKLLAFEYLTGTASIRNNIQNKKWDDVIQEMRTTGEATGMRTLNQSLLGLVIKRKIDVKTAFEATNDPADLDQLFKKVGI